MWFKSCTVIEQVDISLIEQLLLISLTFNRAALLLEIPAAWTHFDLSEVRRRADILVPASERSNVHRFIPGHLERHPGESWSSYSSRSKPPNWSWLDVAAAQGPLSAQAVCQLIDYIFEHQAGSLDPEGVFRSLDIASLESSCNLSAFHSLPSQLAFDPSTRRWIIHNETEAPRKRIRTLDLELHSHIYQRPNDLRHLRFPEHLARAQSIVIQLLSVQSS